MGPLIFLTAGPTGPLTFFINAEMGEFVFDLTYLFDELFFFHEAITISHFTAWLYGFSAMKEIKTDHCASLLPFASNDLIDLMKDFIDLLEIVFFNLLHHVKQLACSKKSLSSGLYISIRFLRPL